MKSSSDVSLMNHMLHYRKSECAEYWLPSSRSCTSEKRTTRGEPPLIHWPSPSATDRHELASTSSSSLTASPPPRCLAKGSHTLGWMLGSIAVLIRLCSCAGDSKINKCQEPLALAPMTA